MVMSCKQVVIAVVVAVALSTPWRAEAEDALLKMRVFRELRKMSRASSQIAPAGVQFRPSTFVISSVLGAAQGPFQRAMMVISLAGLEIRGGDGSSARLSQ